MERHGDGMQIFYLISETGKLPANCEDMKYFDGPKNVIEPWLMFSGSRNRESPFRWSFMVRKGFHVFERHAVQQEMSTPYTAHMTTFLH